MRYNLLEIVQRILESMDSDEVNDITDTPESVSVANIVKECYFDIVSEIGLKESSGLFHLDSSGDNTKPTLMYLPSYVDSISSLKYNVGPTLTETDFRDLTYLCIEDFINYMNGLSTTDSWVSTQEITIGSDEFVFKYRNDNSPTCWTSPNDQIILMDSYDSSYETTLTSSRTYGLGQLIPTFSFTNTHVPDLDPKQFQLLINSAKAQAFIELKQIANEKAERKERRHKILAYKTKDNTDTRSALQKHKGYGR